MIELFSSLWVTPQVVWELIVSQVHPLLPSRCASFFVFGCRISFLVGSSLFLINVCSVICDLGVLVRGGELKVLSTLPSCL